MINKHTKENIQYTKNIKNEDEIMATWNKKMLTLLKQRKWDTKDWHRALGLNQWSLEQLLEMDTSELDENSLENLYQDTKLAKLNKKLMRFSSPVMIVSWTHKGGTGKSTTATNLAYEFSQRGYNTLTIDMDSQSDMSSVLYPEYLNDPDVSFYEAFSLCEDFKEDGYVRHTEYTNLDIIPGSSKCESLEGQLSVMNDKLRSRIWEKCLKSIRKDNYYDFIIIDMDKTAGILNLATLAEADYVLSPIESMIFAVKAIPPILAQIEAVKKTNPKLELLGLLYNKVDMRKKKALAEAMELVEGIAPGAALENFIKNDANVDNSQREHMPLGVYNRSSAANKQMAEVADEILERIRQRSEKVVK